ncbi:metallophosphoesterase [Actinophytocola sp.]|uniref:metallophosphoesterase n=1 Tax=Actinophytocola sp. TaxID=1872138 RepID=UPI00389B0470
MLLAHISDLHIGQDYRGDGGVRALERARRVVNYLNGLPGDLDGVLVSGDLADHGRPDEYATVRELLATLRFPVLACPGNHDDRTAYRTTLLGEEAGTEPINQLHQLGGFTIAMCDSSIPGRNEGLLDDTTLTWLDKVIAESEDPVLVCFHHPPVPMRQPFIDSILLRNPEQLAEVLTDEVVAVLCGHAHTAATTTYAGRPLVVAPGVVSTLVLPVEGDHSIDYGLPPAIAFHVFGTDDTGGRGLITHFRSL